MHLQQGKKKLKTSGQQYVTSKHKLIEAKPPPPKEVSQCLNISSAYLIEVHFILDFEINLFKILKYCGNQNGLRT